MRNGEQVRAFEEAFAEYVGAKYCIALCNGTATLHTALVALDIYPQQPVAVPPLTMSATSIAVLLSGGIPKFVDVDHESWLMDAIDWPLAIPVSLYGLHYPEGRLHGKYIDDAAQTLRPHHPHAAFTSYSFQASKILALGEGGMLATNDEGLATKAREFSSLGYRMKADQPRIDPAALKSPTFARHYSLGANYRMNDLTAKEGLKQIVRTGAACVAHAALSRRRQSAAMYSDAIKGCRFVRAQVGTPHDYWTYAIATDTPERATQLRDACVEHGGEMPFPAWRLTYTEPAFTGLAPTHDLPNAELLQPRLLQFATNNLKSAEANATALKAALEEIA